MSSSATWTVLLRKRAQKGVARAPRPDQERLRAAIKEMESDPFAGDVVRLTGEHTAFRRRVGDWRILFDVHREVRLVEIRSIELLKMGYGNFREDAGHVTGKSGDEGIDGVINQDPLGLDVIALQAKKWAGTVGRPELQRFVGALHGKAKKGVFITTGSFSSEAIAYVKHMDPRVVIIDGKELAERMIKHDVGVTTENTYHVKRVDSEYFDEGTA